MYLHVKDNHKQILRWDYNCDTDTADWDTIEMWAYTESSADNYINWNEIVSVTTEWKKQHKTP